MQDRYLPNLNGLRAISVFAAIACSATRPHWSTISSRLGPEPRVAVDQRKFRGKRFLLHQRDLDQLSSRSGISRYRPDRRQAILSAPRGAHLPLYFLVVIPALVLNVALAGTSLHRNMNFYDYLFLSSSCPVRRPSHVRWADLEHRSRDDSFYASLPSGRFRHLSRRGLVVALLASWFRPSSSPSWSLHLPRPVLPQVLVVANMVQLHSVGRLFYLGLRRRRERLNRSFLSRPSVLLRLSQWLASPPHAIQAGQ